MLKTSVVINGHSYDFVNHQEAITYAMTLATHHHQYAPFETLVKNGCDCCEMIAEYFLILSETSQIKQEAANLKRQSTRMLKSKEYLVKAKDKASFLISWSDLMMTIENLGLLHGFGFGNIHGDTLRGNSEKISMMKAV